MAVYISVLQEYLFAKFSFAHLHEEMSNKTMEINCAKLNYLIYLNINFLSIQKEARQSQIKE